MTAKLTRNRPATARVYRAVARAKLALNPRNIPRIARLSGRLVAVKITAATAPVAAGIVHHGAPAMNASVPAGRCLAPASIHGETNSHPSQKPISGKADAGSGKAVSLSCGRSSSAVSAGLKVRELNAEISVETAIVSANCRKN